MAKKLRHTSWTPEQQARHRKKLVDALESGEYKQTKNKLRGKVGFCCLGVACDISNLGEWVKGEDGGWTYIVPGDVPYDDVLPTIVKDWLGFDDSMGAFNMHSFSDTNLAELNDSGKKFKTIAQIIKSKPEGLLKV